jgi:hypothetical protein
MWVAINELPRTAAHPFYTQLNRVLGNHDFDAYAEELCQRFYAADGRPELPPGRYFRLLLIGYFEGLDAERDRMACRGILFHYASFSGWCCPKRRRITRRFRARVA